MTQPMTQAIQDPLTTGAYLEAFRRPGEIERRARTLISCKAGTALASFGPSTFEQVPTKYTVQVGLDRHIRLRPEVIQYICHSCDPNVRFDVTRRLVIALKPLAAGDELNFFYPSTEWHMVEPFACWCGTERCFGRIAGAKHLPLKAREAYVFEPHIESLFAATTSS